MFIYDWGIFLEAEIAVEWYNLRIFPHSRMPLLSLPKYTPNLYLSLSLSFFFFALSVCLSVSLSACFSFFHSYTHILSLSLSFILSYSFFLSPFLSPFSSVSLSLPFCLSPSLDFISNAYLSSVLLLQIGIFCFLVFFLSESKLMLYL